MPRSKHWSSAPSFVLTCCFKTPRGWWWKAHNQQARSQWQIQSALTLSATGSHLLSGPRVETVLFLLLQQSCKWPVVYCCVCWCAVSVSPVWMAVCTVSRIAAFWGIMGLQWPREASFTPTLSWRLLASEPCTNPAGCSSTGRWVTEISC